MIQRVKTQWGVRLIVKPFTYSKENSEMYIQADISKPRPNRSPEIKFWFSGTTAIRPLRAADILIWREHLKAVSDAARSEAAKMKQRPKESKRKVKKDEQ
jgi:hypothetical protein